jgi:transcription elongation factor Elf1
MTLANAAENRLRLLVSCEACGHRAEFDPAALAAQLGEDFPVPGLRTRFRCSKCGSRKEACFVSGAER